MTTHSFDDAVVNCEPQLAGKPYGAQHANRVLTQSLRRITDQNLIGAQPLDHYKVLVAIDLDQRNRDQVLVRFANNSCAVLVATDVAARGLDIKSLQAVINYELPRDPEIYVHRIGRTGRAGKKGIALSIFTESEQVRVNAIEQFQKKPCICDVYESLDRHPGFTLRSPMVTIQIDAGRKNKIRPGDLLGALTGDAGLSGSQVGKIDIFDLSSYVAVDQQVVRRALNYLANGKVKGRGIRARKLS